MKRRTKHRRKNILTSEPTENYLSGKPAGEEGKGAGTEGKDDQSVFHV
jgi:hypothetical protein